MIPHDEESATALRPLLFPRSLAVIGATEREKSVGRAVLENIRKENFQGPLYPVNPNHPSVLGLQTYPSVEAVPEPVEAAVVIVPAQEAVEAVEACGRKGVKAVTVISAGFKECGAAGAKLEEELRQSAEKHGIVLLGPNCLGIINTDSRVRLNATFARRIPLPGNISFISQSGALGVHALEFAAANGLGLRIFVSIGNKALLHENPILTALGQDPGTRVILLYLEDLHGPEEFLESAAAIASRHGPKPIVLLHAGTSKSGRRAATSHTGALAERIDFLGELCSQYGIIRASNLEELFNHALYLSRQPLPKGPRLALVTNAGGPAVLAADEAERLGLVLPEPSHEVKRALAGFLPAPAALRNPFDLLGDADPLRYEKTLETLIASGEIDALLSICTPQMMTDLAGVAKTAAAQAPTANGAGLPLLLSFPVLERLADGDDPLASAGVPNFPFAENGVRALAAAYRHHEWRGRDHRPPERNGADRRSLQSFLERALQEKRGFLTGWECLTALRGYGIGVARTALVTSRPSLLGEMEGLGFPLVAKIESPDILHKIDVGGVITGIGDVHALEKAYAALLANAAKAKPGGAAVKGVLLQEMIRGGPELMIGAHRHPRFGILMAFGLGGSLVEALRDVRFRRAPLNRSDVKAMILGSKAHAALGAFRGRPPRDISALKDILFRLSWLMEDFPIVTEVDLNPVFPLENGALVADARILIRNPDVTPGKLIP